MGTSLDIDLLRFDRVMLGAWPTPLDQAPRLATELGLPMVLVKRDDVNGLGAGGNKLRKLEFLLGKAMTAGVDTVITSGSVQSNHCRQTAAACARLGLRCELVLTRSVPRQGDPYERSGNVALDRLCGARVHLCTDPEQSSATCGEISDTAEREGRRAVTLPVGGSNAMGVLGYVAAASELRRQLHGTHVDRIVCAVSSAGTAAGLALGTALLGWPVTVDLACVSDSEAHSLAEVRRLVAEAAALLEVEVPGLEHVQATARALGPGYGVPTEQTWQAVRLFARTEGIFLDPVYTGKAAAALVDGVRTGAVGSGETVVFVHTGGMPSLFGYAPELMEAVERD